MFRNSSGIPGECLQKKSLQDPGFNSHTVEEENEGEEACRKEKEKACSLPVKRFFSGSPVSSP